MPSVLPDWMSALPMQQQSVLLLGCRGPDGIRKHHPCKDVVRAYRASVLKAAYFGRPLRLGEQADGFMTMDVLADDALWYPAVRAFFDTIDELPHHYTLHLIHGAQILGACHPVSFVRARWFVFYERAVDDAHMNPETPEQMDKRLGDWGREFWDGEQ